MIVALIINSVVIFILHLLMPGSTKEEGIALAVMSFVVLNYFSYWIFKNKHEDKDLGATILTAYFFFVLYGIMPIQIVEWILPNDFTAENKTLEVIFAITGLAYVIFIFNFLRMKVMCPLAYNPYNESRK
jgi:hypothetical protein